MVIYGVSFDMVGKQPIVLLKTVDSNKFLPIWIGHPEAAAILMKLQGASTPRPMTHDLLSDVLGIDRKFAYRAVNTGEIPSIRIGTRPLIRVPTAALRRLLGIVRAGDEAA